MKSKLFSLNDRSCFAMLTCLAHSLLSKESPGGVEERGRGAPLAPYNVVVPLQLFS
jgi:hypothetical protein